MLGWVTNRLCRGNAGINGKTIDVVDRPEPSLSGKLLLTVLTLIDQLLFRRCMLPDIGSLTEVLRGRS